MKFKITLLLTAAFQIAVAQDLSINPQTGLISIKDSIDINNKSVQEIREVVSKWGYMLLDQATLEKIYNLSNSRQYEKLNVSLPVMTPLTQDKGGNIFVTSGSLMYVKVKKQLFVTTLNTGSAKFNFIYTIKLGKLIYEFTNMEYSHDGIYFGKFEDEKPPKTNYKGKGLVVSDNLTKKEWDIVRKEYFDNLKILANNFKEYTTTLIQANANSANESSINYESYKKITTGMSLEDVVKLLADEGKELSNTSIQVNGKTVTQQTIIWNNLDKTKSITIIFNDGKVVSKSQTNL